MAKAPANGLRRNGGGGSPVDLRRHNLERVLELITDQSGPFTRTELIQATGLSAPTVGSLVTHLMRRGIVLNMGAGPSRGGRRPAHMEFNTRHGYVAGIDLGPTHTRLAVADLRGEPLERRVIETPTEMAPLELLGRIAKCGKELVRKAGVPEGRLLAVGAGAPGVVDRDHGTVMAAAPSMHGWTGVPMADTLKRAFGAPVVVENDVNLAILGERWRGAAQGHDTCAFLSFGTGVGAGIVLDGELRRGHHSLAGEIGFMCMGPEHVETDFGSSGCLETLTGLQALDSRWRGTGDLERWVEELYEGAAAGDAAARETARDVARLVTMAVTNLSLVLDPSLIVMGGALFARGAALLEEVRRRANRLLPRPVEIAVTELHEEAPLWGSLLAAATSAREQLRLSLWEE